MQTDRWESYDRRVLAGLVRLAVCRAEDIARLLGMACPGVSEALLRLRQRGWAQDICVSTAWEDAVQVWLPTGAALAAYASAGVDMAPLVAGERHLQSLLWDTTEAVAVAQLVAGLAGGARQRGLEVVEACRLRSGAPGAVFAGAQGMVIAMGEEWFAPLFVVVDRQERTPARRREMARRWTRLLAEMPSMAGAMLLVVTPTREEMEQWDMYVSASRDRRSLPPPPVYMATAGAIADPWGATWTRTEGRGSGPLYASLHRMGQLPASLPLPFRSARPAALPASLAPGSASRVKTSQHVSAGMRRAITTLLRHPLCRPEELAPLAGAGRVEMERLLEEMERRGLARAVEGRWVATREGEQMGRRLLGVPAAARGVFPAPSTMPHHLEVKAFLARLAQEVRERKGRVLALREAPVTRREYTVDGRARRLTPDGAGAIVVEGKMVHFLLEWDRGTMGDGRWQQKALAYRGYYRWLLRHGQPLYWPLLLVVAPDPGREEAIAGIVRQLLPQGILDLVWTTNAHLLASRGVLGEAWKQVGAERRVPFWAGSEARSNMAAGRSRQASTASGAGGSEMRQPLTAERHSPPEIALLPDAPGSAQGTR